MGSKNLGLVKKDHGVNKQWSNIRIRRGDHGRVEALKFNSVAHFF